MEEKAGAGKKNEVRKEIFSEISRADGLKLEVLVTEPPEGRGLRGILQISHGMCEHKERYLDFMEYISSLGFACLIHDHRGHGASVRAEGDLGYMYGGGAAALLADLHQLTGTARERWPGLPVVLFGHSMGSLAARCYAKRWDNELHELILCGPPGKNPAVGIGKLLAHTEKLFRGGRHASRLLQGLSFGTYAKKFAKEGSSFAWICADPETVAAYEKDPGCGFVFTDDGFLTLFELMEDTYSLKGWRCSKPDLPVLFIGGADDPCIGGVRKFRQELECLRLAGYRNVKGKLYPGLRHEILNENCRYDIYMDIGKYITKNF